MKNTGATEVESKTHAHDQAALACDALRFFEACELVRTARGSGGGIGTLGEKTLHAVLKHYLEPNAALHEVRFSGFVADIKNEAGIIEIQTRSFDKLRKKLDAFLDAGVAVTVVHPIPAKKRLIWLDPATGEATLPRVSPKRGSVYDAFRELYRLGDRVTSPGLRFLILLIDMDEYRLLNGWSRNKKRGSTRFERLPLALDSVYLLETARDYASLLPVALPTEFTSADLASAARLSPNNAFALLRVLSRLGVVRETGKRGRRKLYSQADELK